jgi:hypothetical protein
MKRAIFFLSFLVLRASMAMYQSNPLTPELIDQGLFIRQDFPVGFKAGYQFDRNFNRRLSLSNAGGYVEKAKILLNQGVFTLNFYDSAEIWGSVGAGNFHISNKVKLPFGGYQTIQPYSRVGWIVGTGLRASFFTWKNTTLGGCASYEYSHPKHFRYHEWQIGLGLAQKIGSFIPYVGGTFSRAKAQLRHLAHGTLEGYPSITTLRMHSKGAGGLTLGCDFCSEKIVDVGIEFRAFSELALTAKIDIKL